MAALEVRDLKPAPENALAESEAYTRLGGFLMSVAAYAATWRGS